MNYISEIKPIYTVTTNNRKLISNIDDLLSKIEIKDKQRLANLKMESKVRSIHSSLAIEDNNLSLDTIYNCLLKTTQKIKINNNQQKIIKLIENNPSITRKEIAKEINLTEDGVKYNLNRLKKYIIIERIGPDKGGYWTINRRSDNYEI